MRKERKARVAFTLGWRGGSHAFYSCPKRRMLARTCVAVEGVGGQRCGGEGGEERRVEEREERRWRSDLFFLPYPLRVALYTMP